MDKSNNSIPGYMLSIDQQTIVARVAKALVEVECYLESADVDNSMKCYKDFVRVHKDVHKALSDTYFIMRNHNMTESAIKLAEAFNNYQG